jgi:DUF1009 family protein
MKVLGIIAGEGDLPRQVIKACNSKNHSFFVLAFEGQTDFETIKGENHAWAKLGDVGRAIDLLKAAGVRDLVLAGKFHRPSLLDLKPDLKGAQWLSRLVNKTLGDDGLLRGVIAELESEGFNIIGIDDIIGEQILSTQGVCTAHHPSKDALADISRGVEVLNALSNVDVGQAVVIQQGIVLGLEAIEGTDGLIKRTHLYQRKGPTPILIKFSKIGQDRRVDLPTIGPITVTKAAKAGFQGIAFEAEGVILLNQENMIKFADDAGLFLIGVKPNNDTQKQQ